MLTRPQGKLVRLTACDAGRIAALEAASFIPALRATAETVLERFERGHTMIGAELNGRLVAMHSFYYGRFDPSDRGSYPATLAELCALPASDDYNAVFLYNLEVDPAYRGARFAKSLVHAVLNLAEDAGCAFGVANCRMPSYGGSDPHFGQERIKRSDAFRKTIDRHLQGGPFPAQAELAQDPTLALYQRFTGCRFLWVLPDFAPHDRSCEGIRVIAYGEAGKHRALASRGKQEIEIEASSTPADLA